ncbi:MAG: hypothetical protein N2444_06760, partial [Methylocystis sp.]|nr:hypothetical protein [Methylocystis sp.]
AHALVDTPFAVINADDFYGRAAFEAIARALETTDARSTDFALAGYRIADTLSDHGAVSRGICEVGADGWLRRVVERTHIEKRAAAIISHTDQGEVVVPPDTVVSMNFWGFTPALFPHLESAFFEFLRQNGTSAKAELAIPTVIDGLISAGKARVRVVPSNARWYGMTYPEDKPFVREGIRALVAAGEYPSPLWSS